MSRWIRSGDKVVVIAGNDKGKVGVVLSRLKQKVIVQGVNVRKKHTKRTSEEQPGQIIDIERPIHISNVKIVGSDGHGVKLKVKDSQDKAVKKLVYQQNGTEVVYRLVRKQAG